MKTKFKITNWFYTVAVLIIIFLIIPLHEALSQNEKAKLIQNSKNGLTVTVNISDYLNLEDSKVNKSLEQYIKNGGDYLVDSLGKPNIPVIISKISIPNGMKPLIKITKGEPVIFDNINLSPVQEPLMDCECEREYRYDSIVYQSNKFYPGKLAESNKVKNKRGYKFSDLYMYPYQYNPVKKRLIVYPEMSVTVEFKGSRQAIKKTLKNQKVENFIKNQTINGQKVLQYEFFDEIANNDILNEANEEDISQTNLKSTTKSSSGGCEYLIITHDDFEDAANSLRNWKESIGIQTTVVKTSDINSTYDNDNDATRRDDIEDYIDNAYNNWNPCPEYLLLLGDVEFIPTFIISSDATDIAYADINDPLDYAADIPGYGRLSIDTESEANTIVNRIIDYESTNKGSAFYNNVLGAAYFQDHETGGTCDGTATRGYAETMEDIRNFMENGLNLNFTSVYTAQSCGSTTPTDWLWSCSSSYREPSTWCTSVEPEDLDWNGTTADVTNAIEDGCFLVMHRDHGAYNGWGDPHFRSNNVLALDNGSLRPVVWSINCQTGRFDYASDECFAEYWITHPTGGAAGVIAATRNTGSYSNELFIKGLVDAVWPAFDYDGPNDPIYRLGDILDHGKSIVNSNAKSRRYHYIGDPTMRIFPYNCQAGDIYLSYQTLYNNKTVNACKSVYINNYKIKNGANLAINVGKSFEITSEFEVEIGATFSVEPVDIKTGFKY